LYVSWGQVRHNRFTVKKHAFQASSFFIRINIKRLKDIPSDRWFSIGRGGVFSFNPADHGDGSGTADNPAGWLDELLVQHGISGPTGDIWLHTFPRMMGYLFNPVSFWFVHRPNGDLLAIVCEVNNTFGEKHCYLLSNDGQPMPQGQQWQAQKEFHVSPFFEIMGDYRFRFHHTAGRGVSRVDLFGPDGHRLSTSISGDYQEPDTRPWRATLYQYKWFTLGVMAKIHWQAFHLWRKGVPFFRKPAPPAHLTTSSH
jgi:DUF1365 family protein